MYVDELKPQHELTKIVPWSNCHWGGRRAAVIHDWNRPKRPETLKRPLTQYLYRGAGLDGETPLFRCPSDKGMWHLQDATLAARIAAADPEYLQQKGKPFYHICGNSYSINPWNTTKDIRKTRVRSPSNVVLAEEATMYLDWRYRVRGPGWHGEYATHNILFLDMHVARMRMDTTEDRGDGWYIPSYFEIMDYYN
jgi:hypothetical protein